MESIFLPLNPDWSCDLLWQILGCGSDVISEARLHEAMPLLLCLALLENERSHEGDLSHPS